jgi:hypothetical protein
MHVLITTATLLLLTLAMLLLRIFWPRVPAGVRVYLIRVAVVLITIHIILTITKWETTSDHVNAVIKWLAVASYEMLLVLFTRLRPRWVTSLCSVILLVPVFASSILLPLTYLFGRSTSKPTSIGNGLFYQRVLWGDMNDVSANSGADILLSYRPHYAPFFRRHLRNVTFNNQECNSRAAFAELGPNPKTVLARCPHWLSQRQGTDDWVVIVP